MKREFSRGVRKLLGLTGESDEGAIKSATSSEALREKLRFAQEALTASKEKLRGAEEAVADRDVAIDADRLEAAIETKRAAGVAIEARNAQISVLSDMLAEAERREAIEAAQAFAASVESRMKREHGKLCRAVEDSKAKLAADAGALKELYDSINVANHRLREVDLPEIPSLSERFDEPAIVEPAKTLVEMVWHQPDARTGRMIASGVKDENGKPVSPAAVKLPVERVVPERIIEPGKKWFSPLGDLYTAPFLPRP